MYNNYSNVSGLMLIILTCLDVCIYPYSSIILRIPQNYDSIIYQLKVGLMLTRYVNAKMSPLSLSPALP